MAKPRRVRPSIKALVVRDGAGVVTVNSHVSERFYLLPGGGQDHGESMADTVRRECREEINARVRVGDVAYVRDYIGAHHEFAEWDAHFHQIEITFWCELLTPDDEFGIGHVGDTFQIGWQWLAWDELADAPLYPAELKTWLRTDPAQRPVYLGDVN